MNVHINKTEKESEKQKKKQKKKAQKQSRLFDIELQF